MKSLLQLQDDARNDESLRRFFIVLNNGKRLIGRFLDPWLGLMEFDDLPGKCVSAKQLADFNPEGLFII